MAVIDKVSDRERIDLIYSLFEDNLKHNLIAHPNTRFFVYRIPVWNGIPIEFDIFHQRVNGVINVDYTADRNYPIWSPIDTYGFESYLKDMTNIALRNKLASQIVDVLYTVRNNLAHGGKRADDVTDEEVLVTALEILRVIVHNFIQL